MKFVRIIDKEGLFVEDAFVEELHAGTVEKPCPEGLNRPKWNGSEWIEGMPSGPKNMEPGIGQVTEEITPEDRYADLEKRIACIEEQIKILLTEREL